MDYYLNFQQITQGDLNQIIERTRWKHCLHNGSNLQAFNQLQRSFVTDQPTTPFSSSDVLKAIELAGFKHSDCKLKSLIVDLNEYYSGGTTSDEEIRLLGIELCKQLGSQAGLPLEILPTIQVKKSRKAEQIGVIRGSYNSVDNIITLYAPYCQSYRELTYIVAHEFQHFIDDLETRKLQLQNPALAHQTACELWLEQVQGRDLALTHWGLTFSEMEFENHLIFCSLLNKELQQTCIQLMQLDSRQLDNSITLDRVINPETFIATHIDTLNTVYKRPVKEDSMSVVFINSFLKRFNEASPRDRYAHLSKLGSNQARKAAKLLKGRLQSQTELSKKADSRYTPALYWLNEEEIIARMSGYAQALKSLLKNNVEFKDQLRSRPLKGQSLDEQPVKWIEMLSSTVIGEDILNLATLIKIDSVQLALSRQLRQETAVFEPEDVDQMERAIADFEDKRDPRAPYYVGIELDTYREPSLVERISTRAHTLNQRLKKLFEFNSQLGNRNYNDGYVISQYATEKQYLPLSFCFDKESGLANVAIRYMPAIQRRVLGAMQKLKRRNPHYNLENLIKLCELENYRRAFLLLHRMKEI